MTTEKLDLTGASEVQSNWMKFTEVGSGIKGTLVNTKFQKSSTDTFPDQWVYQIKKDNGEIWNVGISTKKQGTCERLNKCKNGEIIAIVFESEGESAVKGGHKAKNLKVYSFGMDSTYKVDGDEVDLETINL